MKQTSLIKTGMWSSALGRAATPSNTITWRRLNGTLPRDLGLNSPLIVVKVSGNEFSSEIPDVLCKKGVLEELLIIDNKFSGKIPASLAQCRSLLRIRLKVTCFPVSFWGLPHVYLLELARNLFSEEISSMIASATNLSLLFISDNQFTGGTPAEISSLQTLVEFSRSRIRLSSSIPKTIEKLELLGRLDLHNNELSGEIPAEIQSCKKLNEINLAENELSGQIPSEIGYLPVLNYLDLSENRLTGEIPFELQNLKLNYFNLSSNRFSGKLPPMYAKEKYRESSQHSVGAASCTQERKESSMCRITVM